MPSFENAEDVPDDTALKGGPRVLAEQPKLLGMIGLIAAEWSAMEERLALLYGYLMGQRGPALEYGHPIDPVAIHIFYQLEPRHQRQRLLRTIASIRLDARDVYPELSEAIRLMDRAARARNDLMHTRLGVSDSYPSSLVAIPLVGDMKEIDERFLDEALADIEAAQQAVSKAEYAARVLLNKPC
jgi:hypothetical protein